MSAFTMAKRQNGVCEGSLRKIITASGSKTPNRSSSSSSTGVFGLSFSKRNTSSGSQNAQTSSESLSTYSFLVGVSLICYESTTSVWNGDHPLAQYSLVGVSAVSDDPTAFRAVTDMGTHLLCNVPTKACRDVWLSALDAGLEYRLQDIAMASMKQLMSPIAPKLPRGVQYKSDFTRHCGLCGEVELNKSAESPSYYGAPMPHYGSEERMDVCSKCHMAEGVLENCYWIEELYATHHQEQNTMLEARRLVLKKLTPNSKQQSTSSDSESEEDSIEEEDFTDRDTSGRILPKSHTLRLEPMSHHMLSLTLESSEGVALQRRSPTLKSLCVEFQQGLIDVLEFLELLEAAIGIRDPAMAEMKKQAFRVAADMGTALKLLYEQCLPPTENSGSTSSETPRSNSHRQSNLGSNNLVSTELVQCILEFFLDLVTEEDELSTLAFFWPQISNIHLQMLPPKDTLSLQKVELLEDFLLTIASKHSVHLAIELVCSHTADLEDAQSGSYNGSTTTYCGRRKYAVLRFLCELESQIFDFDSGWGGGSITVGQFYTPSEHQSKLLQDSFDRIQKCRLSTQHVRLSRSHRLDKLKQQKSNGATSESSQEALALEKVRLANNADYLSSHLSFTKRLCDIAEKLRFLPINERKGALSTELANLNASGTMGGDPTNVIKEANEGHTRVVRFPIMEGHVFRSKARTPVLLLVETIDEGVSNIEEEKEDAILPRAANMIPIEEESELSCEEVEAPSQSNDNSGNSVRKGSEDSITSTLTTDTEKNKGEDKLPENENTDIIDEGNSECKKEVEIDLLNQSIDQDPLPVSTNPLTPVSGTEKKKNHAFDDVVMPELDTVTRTERVGSLHSCASSDTLGSNLSASQHEKLGARRHSLRRFESPKTKPKIITPQANKELVEHLMTDVIAKQLHMPNLTAPNLLATDENKINVDESPDEDSMGLSLAESDSSIEKEEQQEGAQQQQEQQSDTTPNYSKMKNLGTFVTSGKGQFNALHKTGGTRREVLTAIMTKGMSGSHIIAEQAATGAKRHLQDLERRVAVEALLTSDSNISHDSNGSSLEKDDSRKELLNLGISSSKSKEDLTDGHKTEDDETMEAVRLLLIQYRVVDCAEKEDSNDGDVTIKKAPPKANRTIMHNGQEFPEIEAGDVDTRLVGCGPLPPAVLQALTLWKGDMISNGELLELIKKDIEFEKKLKAVEQNTDKLNEDSAFWGRFAFGERWAEKRSRIAASSPDASTPGWDLTGIIVKSNDDLRQESFVMQLIELCHEAFQEAELELWLLPYRIVSTSRSTGIMGLIRNAMSFDGLKKRPGYGTGGIRGHLQRMTEHAANPGEAFQLAQKNFVRSLAAYSLLSYMFLFKDRHNGNIMLDTDGHVIHIDFGFVFGIAPGGNFSLELTTPFKLTEEMIEVMDGLRSSLFSEFVTLFCCGFLALQAHYTTFVTLVEVTSRGSTFPCFDGRDTAEIINKMKERFCPDLNQEESVAHVLDVIKEAVDSYGTKQYDFFQYMSQGIAT